MDKTAEILFNYVRDIIYEPKKAALDVSSIDPGFMDLARGLQLLNQFLIEERELAYKLADGILEIDKLPDNDNVMAYPLKTLHSSLKHVAWKAKQIEKGDFSQRLDFAGEFADIFNNMADQLKKSREELERQAFRDPLTKLYNRRFGMDSLAKMIEKGKAFSVCFIDLDNLKYVNDILGHTEGDRFITTAADRLISEFGDGIVARIGGDEFMAILPGGSEEENEKRIGRVSLGLAEFGRRPDGASRQPLSHGVIEVEAGSKVPASEILAEADKKMYAVKAKHKADYQDARRGQ